MKTVSLDAAVAACDKVLEGIIDSRYDMSIDWKNKFVKELTESTDDTFTMERSHIDILKPLYSEFRKNCIRVYKIVSRTKEYCGNVYDIKDINSWEIFGDDTVYGSGIDKDRDDVHTEFPATLLTMTNDELEELVNDILVKEKAEEEIERKAQEMDERAKAEQEYNSLKEKYGFK